MEKLSSDILEDDFIKIFEPIHWVQFVAGFHRVKIEHKYVTAPSVYYQIYSSVVWAINIIAVVDFVLNCETKMEGISNMYALKTCEPMIMIINAVIAYRNNFYDGTLNSQIYVKLQKIDRIVKMDGAVNFNRKMFLLSALVTCIVLVGWSICVTMLNLISMRTVCFTLFFVQFSTVASFMENMLVAFMLLFLATRLNSVNGTLEKEAKKLREAGMSIAAAGFYQEKNQDHDKLVVAIYHILDSYKDCIRLFQFQILSFTCQVLGAAFAVMLSIVTAIRDKTSNTNYIIINLVVFLLGMTSVLTLSFLATMISSKMRMTRSICFNVSSMPVLPVANKDKLQKNARHILMMLGTTSTFTIYNIYSVDNRLPLRIFAITANYTIVLLQFATL